MYTLFRCITLVATAVIALARTSLAQCSEWDARFHSQGVNEGVDAMLAFDDGSGPALYVSGYFTAAGDTAASNIARWNGSTWSAVGDGLPGEVSAMCVFDDGTGPALYVGGMLGVGGGIPASRVARWDGSRWTLLDTQMDGPVYALASFDDGSGPTLYAGGSFTKAGGSNVNKIARWDGATWSAVGGGVSNGPYAAWISGLTVFDDGSGAALYAAGWFNHAGAVSANEVAKWDGASWSALGSGLTVPIGPSSPAAGAMAVFEDGSGPALYVGGTFSQAGGVAASCIARWDGSSWTALGAGANQGVSALAVFDDGSGDALYVGGRFTAAGGAPAAQLAKWDGASWSNVGSGTNERVSSFGVFDDGTGKALFLGGLFDVLDGVSAENVAKWDGQRAAAVGDGDGLSGIGLSLAVFDDGSGPAVYAGGEFATAGDAVANHIAKWDGERWTTLSSGVDDLVSALAVFDDNSGPSLYVGGLFSNAGGTSARRIAKWDGSSWSALGGGLDSGSPDVAAWVGALAVFDDGSGAALYVAGDFAIAGGVSARNIARWDGSSWSPLASGTNGGVRALAVFDDGSGPALYAGGGFSTAGSSSVKGVAKWSGAGWSPIAPLTTGLGDWVFALSVFDDGTGGALYAAGRIAMAGGTPAHGIAKWDGTTWSSLAGVSPDWSEVYALLAFDDGSGDALYAGGTIHAGTRRSPSLAKWDGATWSDMGIGGLFVSGGDTDIGVAALASFGAGTSTPDLYVAGDFSLAGSAPSSHIAAWLSCGDYGAAYCFGDGLDPLVTVTCPCGTFGAPGHGCANSNASLGGGRLTAAGETNPNTLVFTCTGIPNNLCTFLVTTASNDAGVVFGGGIRCLAGSTASFGKQIAGRNGNPANTARAPAASFASGTTRYYALQYRDLAPTSCPDGGFNLSNGFVVHW